MPEAWRFYGRRTELERLRGIFARGRWFFLRISGRRRIGKPSLVNEARLSAGREKVLYIQIPDSDPAGVVSAARDYMQMFGLHKELPSTLHDLAKRIGALAEEAGSSRSTSSSTSTARCCGSSPRSSRRRWIVCQRSQTRSLED